METLIIRITTQRHNDSDLMVAYSDDLRGLLVAGRSEAQLTERLPAAIRELLEAQGHEVIAVEMNREAPDDVPAAFAPPKFKANARYAN